jgi:hypothetical protein
MKGDFFQEATGPERQKSDGERHARAIFPHAGGYGNPNKNNE